MFWINVKRIVKSGYTSFMRSGFTSLASVLVMTITLTVFTGLIYLEATLHTSLNNIKDKVDVTIYFVPGTAEDKIMSVKETLTKVPEVASVSYTSQEEALASFREKHANDYLTIQALDELNENPLGASLNVKAKDPSQYESIAKYFDQNNDLSKEALTIIDKIDFHQNKVVIDRLTAIIVGAQRLGFAISLILVLVSIMITFNTIRLIIYMSREEIGVMRLVGAGNKYIRGPFMVGGALVGIFASVITMLIFWPVSVWLGSQMAEFLGINLLHYYTSNFFQLFFILLFSGIILGGISSLFAIHRYLRK
jgi:cell division transport system permease protein